VALVTSCPTNKFWVNNEVSRGRTGSVFRTGDSWNSSLRFASSNEALVFAYRTQGCEGGMVALVTSCPTNKF